MNGGAVVIVFACVCVCVLLIFVILVLDVSTTINDMNYMSREIVPWTKISATCAIANTSRAKQRVH